MAHEHGPHTCYCPSCGSQVTADTGVRCSTLICPDCGQPMRALETGEYRASRGRTQVASRISGITTASIKCPVCSWPVPDPGSVGAQVKCVYCGQVSESINQEVIVPSWLFWLGIGLTVGTLLGPSILATTEAGSQYLARKARERMG